jgi:phosphate transport system substrate-binding protein
MNLRSDLFGRALSLLLTASLAALSFGCGGVKPVGKGGDGATTDPGGTIRLQGTGATFPMPVYQKWVSEYGKAHRNVQIDYQSTGSGTGINQISSGTVDFGASDKPMTDEELQKAQGELLHIPTVLGAVAVTFNLPGVTELKLSGQTLANIYLGRVTKWNDPAIAADNPGVSLPGSNIVVAARADGSGTSAVFTDFLSKVSPDWKGQVSTGTNPNWPTGQRARGNEGVTAVVKQNVNSIGYVEQIYAEQQKLPVAAVRNAAGNFVKPTLDSVAAAAAAALPSTPEDMRVSITDPQNSPDAYPISSYTYILVYREQRDPVKGRALVDFLWWALHDGTEHARALSYAPLPEEVRRRAEQKLNSITADGRPIRGA